VNRVRTAAVLLLLAGPLVACNEDVDASGNQEERVRAGDTYVALGDSYTAGPLIGETTGPAACGQTDGNYPHLLAERLDLELVDVSCGGATTEDLTEPQVRPNGAEVPPQLDALTEDTALVTLRIGGNDGGVFANLVSTCVALGAEDPDGEPCTTMGRMDNGRLAQEIEDLSGRIEEAVGDILERAPRARVIVVGYPQIFPESGACEDLPLATGDYPFAASVMQQIVDAQESAAEAADAEYIDVFTATQGHDICADDPWIAGAVPKRPGLAYHPYAEEQDVVADLLMAKISSS
jgi:lysophospholipase L1-like esterase